MGIWKGLLVSLIHFSGHFRRRFDGEWTSKKSYVFNAFSTSIFRWFLLNFWHWKSVEKSTSKYDVDSTSIRRQNFDLTAGLGLICRLNSSSLEDQILNCQEIKSKPTNKSIPTAKRSYISPRICHTIGTTYQNCQAACFTQNAWMTQQWLVGIMKYLTCTKIFSWYSDYHPKRRHFMIIMSSERWILSNMRKRQYHWQLPLLIFVECSYQILQKSAMIYYIFAFVMYLWFS